MTAYSILHGNVLRECTGIEIDGVPYSAERIKEAFARLAELRAEVERLTKERDEALEQRRVAESNGEYVRDHWYNQFEKQHDRAAALQALLSEAPDKRHFEILAEAMAEVKASSDGKSDQPIAEIVAGCLAEIAALPDRNRTAHGGNDE